MLDGDSVECLIKLDADENGSHASVRFALMANVLDQASLTATFQNKASR